MNTSCIIQQQINYSHLIYGTSFRFGFRIVFFFDFFYLCVYFFAFEWTPYWIRSRSWCSSFLNTNTLWNARGVRRVLIHLLSLHFVCEFVWVHYEIWIRIDSHAVIYRHTSVCTQLLLLYRLISFRSFAKHSQIEFVCKVTFTNLLYSAWIHEVHKN